MYNPIPGAIGGGILGGLGEGMKNAIEPYLMQQRLKQMMAMYGMRQENANENKDAALHERYWSGAGMDPRLSTMSPENMPLAQNYLADMADPNTVQATRQRMAALAQLLHPQPSTGTMGASPASVDPTSGAQLPANPGSPIPPMIPASASPSTMIPPELADLGKGADALAASSRFVRPGGKQPMDNPGTAKDVWNELLKAKSVSESLDPVTKVGAYKKALLARFQSEGRPLTVGQAAQYTTANTGVSVNPGNNPNASAY